MTKPPKNKKEEIDFQSLMQNVKRLKTSKIHYQSKIPRAKIPIQKQNYTDTSDFSDHESLPEVKAEDLLFYAKDGLQDKILRNLRRGLYNVEAILDLHGRTVEESRMALGNFLIECQRRNLRHVLIIHGKGRINAKPILKNKLNHWLRQTEDIIAFCSATPRFGEKGALFVLLRRNKLGK